MPRLSTLFLAALFLAGCGTHKSNIATRPSTKGDTTGTTVVATPPVLPPKAMRGVWIATVGNIDWPVKYITDASGIEREKATYRRYLDSLATLHVNTVMFQVRPMADAFYASPYEPWSRYLSGTRGNDPGWNPLPWLISETHKRGMQFHAWLNPYRVAMRKDRRTPWPKLNPSIPGKWVKTYRLLRVYNPALPEVRQRVADVVRDLLTHYDIDGIHFDDYFYPALTQGERMNDEKEYRQYGRQFSNIADFRRANVDSMIVLVGRTIRAVRPGCLFSVSPQGNHYNDLNTMYCNVDKWAREGWIDVLIPQLYWSTERFFTPRLKEFADLCTNTHYMVGYGLYRFSPTAKSSYFRTNDDLHMQLSQAAANPKVEGAMLYSARWLIDNPCDINAALRKAFATPALPPYLGHAPMVRPQRPGNVRAEKTTTGMRLTWSPVEECYYAVYRSNGGGHVATLVAITYEPSAIVDGPGEYLVTAVTRGLNAESEPARAASEKAVP